MSNIPDPVAYKNLNRKYNQINFLKRTPLNSLMSSLDNDLYQIILWEGRVARYLEFIQWGRDPVYLADFIYHQWG